MGDLWGKAGREHGEGGSFVGSNENHVNSNNKQIKSTIFSIMTHFLKLRLSVIYLTVTLLTVTACTSCDKECVWQKIAELFGNIITKDLPSKLEAGVSYLIPTLIENSFRTISEIAKDCIEIGQAGESTTRMEIEYDDLDNSNGSGYHLLDSKEFLVLNGYAYSTGVDFAEPRFTENDVHRYDDYYQFNREGKYRVNEYVDNEFEVPEHLENNNMIRSTIARSISDESPVFSFEIEVFYRNEEDRKRLMALPPVQINFDSKRKVKHQ